jgi:hypothetical protein
MGVKMIEFRTVRNELDRLDELNRQAFCADCADSAEARCSGWRLAFERAAARGDAGFMVCANCAARWLPELDINHAVRGWTMVTSEGRLAAVICVDCEAAHPEPTTIPSIAQLLLSQSRGPIQWEEVLRSRLQRSAADLAKSADCFSLR